MSAYRPTSAWVKRGTPKPANFDELSEAARRRDGAAFAHEFAVLCANTRAEGYPPPTLIGWLDEETGEIQ